jgi:hypothetical protein
VLVLVLARVVLAGEALVLLGGSGQ